MILIKEKVYDIGNCNGVFNLLLKDLMTPKLLFEDLSCTGDPQDNIKARSQSLQKIM